MAYIFGVDRNQTRMIATSLDDLIDKDNSVRVIDAYVESLNLQELGFIEYSGSDRGQSPYRRSDLLKLHIYGYINKIRSSRALELEARRNISKSNQKFNLPSPVECIAYPALQHIQQTVFHLLLSPSHGLLSH